MIVGGLLPGEDNIGYVQVTNYICFYQCKDYVGYVQVSKCILFLAVYVPVSASKIQFLISYVFEL